jgi:invasion protein IalB
MRKTVLAAISTFLLTSCDATMPGALAFAHAWHLKPVTVVLPPGFMINIDGQDTPAFGFDSCPPDNHDKSGCTVIEPDTEVVRLIVAREKGPLHEAWAVKRVDGITSLEAIR